MSFFNIGYKTKDNNKQNRINNEIESLQVRKDTAISVYQKEISELLDKRTKIINDVGELAYKRYLEQEEITLDLFREFWGELDSLSKEKREKDEKQYEIIARYDEEIEMLKKEINYMEDIEKDSDLQKSIKEKVIFRCPQCGAEVVDGDCFCENCGAKLNY